VLSLAPIIMSTKVKTEADLCLDAFLREADEVRRDQLLEELIGQYARPVIKRIIASKLNIKQGRRDSVDGQDQEDVGEEVIVQLIRRLTLMKSGGESPFGSFEDYVATAAYNACSNYLRRKYPARSRLRDRLRYILSHHKQLAMWQQEKREWLCGFASWDKQQRSRRSPDRLRQLRADPDSINYFSDSAQQERDILRLVKAIFEFVGAPVSLDDLVAVVGDILGANDKSAGATPNDQFDAVTDETGSVTESVFADRIDKQAYLKQVWKEICELPSDQRAAMLLNLKDRDGSDITFIFVSSGVATISEMAETLGISVEEFLDLWKNLPLSDEDIAIRLGIRVQRVASLRQSGRRRLSRRMDLYERQKSSQVRQARDLI
jgi:DNA-directed RNA polymerase specialized sigma24 family protein